MRPPSPLDLWQLMPREREGRAAGERCTEGREGGDEASWAHDAQRSWVNRSVDLLYTPLIPACRFTYWY